MTETMARALLLTTVALSSIAALSACGGGGGSSSSGGGQAVVPPPPPPPPPMNNPPEIDPASLLQTVDENVVRPSFGIIARDVEAPSLTFSKAASPDADFFEVDPDTGTISITQIYTDSVPWSPDRNFAFDFERPVDADQDNDYLVAVTVSDGTDSVTETITIRVVDDPESEFCLGVRELTLAEDSAPGVIDELKFQAPGIYIFSQPEVTDPERLSGIFTVGGRSSPEIYEENLVYLTQDLDYETVGPDPISLIVRQNFDFANPGEETLTCEFLFTVTDVPGSVSSGAQLSGIPMQEVMAVNDVDADGVPELFSVADPSDTVDETTRFARLVFGGGIGGDIASDGTATIDLSADPNVRTIQLVPGLGANSGVTPEHQLRVVGTGDFNGNGQADLVMSFAPPANRALDETIASDDVPVGYIMFDTLLQNAAVTAFNLATFSESEGVRLFARGTGNLRGAQLAVAELTGDGQADIAISLPLAQRDGAAQLPELLIVDNAAISGASGSEADATALPAGQGLRLIGADRDGEDLRLLGDIDSAGSDELLLNGLERAYVIRGEDIVTLTGANTQEQAINALPTQALLPNWSRQVIPDTFGDVDGDGRNDLGIGLNIDVPGQRVVVLTFADAIANILGGTSDNSRLFVRDDDIIAESQPAVTFLGDLDGDGGSEVLVRYSEAVLPTGEFSNPNRRITVSRHKILTSSLLTRNPPTNQNIDIRALSAPDAVDIINLDVGREGDFKVFTPLGDLDGDGLGELHILRAPSDQGFILRGSDLRANLIAGTAIDVAALVNDETPTP